MKEESGPSKKCIQKSKWLTEKQERHERLNECVAEAYSDADDFDKYNNLLLSLYIHTCVRTYIHTFIHTYIHTSWNMLLKRLIFYFWNMYKCFTISLWWKVKRATIGPPPRHARACPLTCLREWFYLILFACPHSLLLYCFIWYILSLFLFAGHFDLPTSIGGLSWGFEWRGPAEDGRSSKRPSRRLLRSQRTERPNRRLLSSRTSKTRLMTSHRSPTS
jgi:hypothetical protein